METCHTSGGGAAHGPGPAPGAPAPAGQGARFHGPVRRGRHHPGPGQPWRAISAPRVLPAAPPGPHALRIRPAPAGRPAGLGRTPGWERTCPCARASWPRRAPWPRTCSWTWPPPSAPSSSLPFPTCVSASRACTSWTRPFTPGPARLRPGGQAQAPGKAGPGPLGPGAHAGLSPSGQRPAPEHAGPLRGPCLQAGARPSSA